MEEVESYEVKSIKKRIQKLKYRKEILKDDVNSIDEEIFTLIAYLYGIGSYYEGEIK